MKTFLISVLFVICITGCGTPSVWYQTGVNRHDTDRDLAHCKFLAEQQSNPLAMVNGWFWLGNETHKNDLIKDCMMAKGFVWTKETEIPKTYHLGPQAAQTFTPASSSTRLDATH